MEMFAFVGETLRRLRKERGKTLAQLGQEAQVGKGQLSRIENSRQEATFGTLQKVLAAHGVNRQDFFRRYDLVEAEATAVRRARPGPAPARGEGPVPEGPRWPDEVRDAIGRFETFLRATLDEPRPLAQGAVEVGDYVVFFRVVSKQAAGLEPEGDRPDRS